MLFCCACQEAKRPVLSNRSSMDSAIAYSERVYDSGYREKALAHIVQAHKSLPDLTIDDHMNYYNYCNTIYMNHFKDYNTSMQVGDSMISLLKETGNLDKLVERHIEALNIKADAMLAQGLYVHAYDNYYHAKKLASANADSCSLSRYSYSLAMVLYKQKKYNESAVWFRNSLGEAKHCSNEFTFFYRRQEVLDNIGLCYRDRKSVV